MKLILLGLCNPGKKYEQTWHSIGAECIKKFLEQENIKINNTGLYAYAETNNILFAFSRSVNINESGKLLLSLKQKYQIKPEQLIVAHDEVMQSIGQIKCTFGGSAKGHNGLRSIINLIGTDFYRIKIGVGHPGKGSDLGKYLLKTVQTNLWKTCTDNFLKEITWERFENVKNKNQNSK